MALLVKSKMKTAISAFGVAFGLVAGSAMATPVVVTSATEPLGGVSVQLNHSPAPVGDPVSAGRIDLGTAAGILQSYCVDIFHYTATPTTYDMNLLSTGSTYSNGTSTVNWTATQVNRIEALLIAAANPALVETIRTNSRNREPFGDLFQSVKSAVPRCRTRSGDQQGNRRAQGTAVRRRKTPG